MMIHLQIFKPDLNVSVGSLDQIFFNNAISNAKVTYTWTVLINNELQRA
jgi:hypothetical protein